MKNSRSVLFWTLVGTVIVMFFLLFALVVFHSTHAGFVNPSPPVEDFNLYPPRIYYDWSNRQPGVPVADLEEAQKWLPKQPFVFKLHSDNHYLMMWYDRFSGYSFTLNPADYNAPALTIEDIETLLDPTFVQKVNEKISHLEASRWKHLQLPDQYRLDDVCWLERYTNLCENNVTGGVRVKLWQVPLSKSGYIRDRGEHRPSLRLAAMWDPTVGQTLFNTFPGRFSLAEWQALTKNESRAEIFDDFIETIE